MSRLLIIVCIALNLFSGVWMDAKPSLSILGNEYVFSTFHYPTDPTSGQKHREEYARKYGKFGVDLIESLSHGHGPQAVAENNGGAYYQPPRHVRHIRPQAPAYPGGHHYTSQQSEHVQNGYNRFKRQPGPTSWLEQEGYGYLYDLLARS